MICLTDNDIIRKLAFCDLLPEAITVLGGTMNEVFVLPAARYVLLQPRKKGPHSPASPVRDRIKTFLDAAQLLPEAPPEELRVLSGFPKIDPGEQHLFAVTAMYPNFRMLTGDKKCLEALVVADDALANVRERLAGRVVCFEQILLLLIQSLGFQLVLTRVLNGLDCDRMLRSVFSRGIESPEDQAREGLLSYITALRTEAPGLLMPDASP